MLAQLPDKLLPNLAGSCVVVDGRYTFRVVTLVDCFGGHVSGKSPCNVLSKVRAKVDGVLALLVLHTVIENTCGVAVVVVRLHPTL